MLACFLFSSCAVDTDPEESPLSPDNTLSTRYLSLKISSTRDQSSRASSDHEFDLEAGTESENNVAAVRFYFFDDEGEPVAVSRLKDAYQNFLNYYDWTPGNNVNDGSNVSKSGNVEKTFNATLSLCCADDNLPTRMIVIVNPSSSLDSYGICSLSNLLDIALDFETDLTDYNFVMTNSAYVSTTSDNEGDSREVVCPVVINEDNLATTISKARENPVTVYVERIVSRIDISFSPDLKISSIGDRHNLIPLKYKSPQTESEADIFVEFLGWGVTSAPKSSRLLKKINPDWIDEDFFSASYSWNSPELFRSHWAVNPESFEYSQFSFTDLTGLDLEGNVHAPHPKCFLPDLSRKMSAYTLENANPFSLSLEASAPQYPSKVIFAARLIDTEGNPISLAEYDSKTYTIEDLKTIVVNKVEKEMWYEDPDNPGHFKSIEPKDIEFVTSSQLYGNSGPDVKDTYYVYYRLTDEARNRHWYHIFSSADNKEDFIIDDPDKIINDLVFPAKIWNKGFTYYYFEIPHYVDADKKTFPGVVRNHLYDAMINQILTLGTPVYDPTETIFPETPRNEGMPLDVTVKTLKWRVESQDVTFTW